MEIDIPNGHGPWCGCGVCQACTRSLSPSTQFEIAAALYKAELERSIPGASRRELEMLWNANAELKMRLADIERMYLGYEVTRYAPPSQMRTVEYRTLAPREPRSPAVVLAIVGMLIALAFVSQILLYFH